MPAILPGIPAILTLGTAAAGAGSLVQIGVFLGASFFATEIGKGFLPDTYIAPSGIELQKNQCATGISLPLVYGYVRVGGDDVFMGVTGIRNEYLWIVQALAEGPCDGIAEDDESHPLIFINDIRLDEFEAAHGNLVDYTFYSGTMTQTYDTTLAAAFSSFATYYPDDEQVSFDDNMQNTCYIVWKITLDRSVFSSIPTRNVVLKGRKVWLPNDTKAYSNNAAAVLYDYLRSAHCAFNLGNSTDDQLLLDEIDYSSYLAAYNYCESNGWTFDGAIMHNETAKNAVDRISKYFRGAVEPRESYFTIKYRDLNEETPVMTISDDQIARDESGKALVSVSQPGRSQEFDGLRVAYIDTTNGLYNKDYVMIGDEEGIIKDVDLTGICDRELAGIMGNYIFERSRDPYDRTYSLVCSDDVQQIERGDLVTVTCDALDFSSQYVRVIAMSRYASGLVRLDVILEHSDLYNDVFDAKTVGYYEYNLPEASDFDPTQSPEYLVDLDDGDFVDSTYTLTVGMLNKVYVVTSNNNLTIELPSIEAYDLGAWVKIIHYGTGKLTIQAADSDYIDTSSSGGSIYHLEQS